MARGLSTLVVDWSTPDLRIFFVAIFVKKSVRKEHKKSPVRGFLLIQFIKDYWKSCGANWLRYTRQFLQVCPPSLST
jgi:hypothetical protein